MNLHDKISSLWFGFCSHNYKTSCVWLDPGWVRQLRPVATVCVANFLAPSQEYTGTLFSITDDEKFITLNTVKDGVEQILYIPFKNVVEIKLSLIHI